MISHLVLGLVLVVSFAATWALIGRWMKIAQKMNFVSKDMNKYEDRYAVKNGGIAVMGGILAGVMTYLAANTFLLDQVYISMTLLAVLASVMFAFIIGFFDDVLGWKAGLSQFWKMALTLPIALPMMVINAGETNVGMPFFGTIDLGILYPLLAIPLIMMFTTNAFNMYAGYNGLEAGLGMIVLAFLGLASLLWGSTYIALICGIGFLALSVFLRYNWFPARIFPANSTTYLIGALIGCVIILGNLHKLGLFLMIPYLLDFLLPLRKKMKVEAFAKPNPDGSLSMPYGGIYDMTHLAIWAVAKLKQKVYETDVVWFCAGVEIIFGLIGLTFYIIY